MKINRIDSPFPAISIDDFIPSESLVRAAAESFRDFKEDNWVKYSGENGQVQYCSKIPRKSTPASLLVLDYISTFFDPNVAFDNLTTNAFPDVTHYGGGMMLTPNVRGEGGFLGMHVDADVHGAQRSWKREYSAILCISEEYDSSFDLLIHDGKKSHARLPYKFNRLNVFKCSENSWHGLPEITRGLERKTLGVMYWSKMSQQDQKAARVKAKFNNDLDFG
jgi:hypothetical protein